MAIADGFWLSRCLDSVDLADRQQLAQGLARYDKQRVQYTNKHAIMARRTGHLFHHAPWPLSSLRDAVFNHTGFLEHVLVKNYLEDSEAQMLALQF